MVSFFSRKGKPLIGMEGCSRFFILGLLDVLDPIALQNSFDQITGTVNERFLFQGCPFYATIRAKNSTCLSRQRRPA